MRVMRLIGLFLIVLSALSFCLTLHLVLTNKGNSSMGSIFADIAYHWFFGYYRKSHVDNDFNPLKTVYSPFPSVLGGIYFLVCGIVLWFVKTDNPAQWFYCGNIRDKRCVLLLLSLFDGGLLFLCLSTYSMLYGGPYGGKINVWGNYPYQQYSFPLALVGAFLLTLGTFVFCFAITKSKQDTLAPFLVFLMVFLFFLTLFIFFIYIPWLFSFR